MGALAFSSLSPPLLLRHIFRPPSPPPLLRSLFIFKKPLQKTPLPTFFASLSSSSYSRSLSLSSSSSPPHSLAQFNSQTKTPLEDDEFESESESEEEFEREKEEVSSSDERSSFLDSSRKMTYKEMVSKLPSLSVKEKKELASYAHSLGKKLKSQQVGKAGVTDALAAAMVESLESKELLKLKIHSNCPGELDDVVNQLEAATGSVIVGRIGRTVILYRPSLTKFKAEEKKKLNQRIYIKKQLAWKASLQNRRASTRVSDPVSRGRGRRGSSRNS
ncbi:hypothetical protein LguiA_027565 [Lonicera macranthoides]